MRGPSRARWPRTLVGRPRRPGALASPASTATDVPRGGTAGAVNAGSRPRHSIQSMRPGMHPAACRLWCPDMAIHGHCRATGWLAPVARARPAMRQGRTRVPPGTIAPRDRPARPLRFPLWSRAASCGDSAAWHMGALRRARQTVSLSMRMPSDRHPRECRLPRMRPAARVAVSVARHGRPRRTIRRALPPLSGVGSDKLGGAVRQAAWRVSLLFDWRGTNAAYGYAGGGVSFTFPTLFGAQISRGFSVDLDLLTYAVDERPSGSATAFLLAMGTDSYSDFLGGGRRRYLDPNGGQRRRAACRPRALAGGSAWRSDLGRRPGASSVRLTIRRPAPHTAGRCSRAPASSGAPASTACTA